VQLLRLRRSTFNEHNNSGKKSEPTTKRAKPRDPMRRDTKEVLAELVENCEGKAGSEKARSDERRRKV
jgi:hypothetical protein